MNIEEVRIFALSLCGVAENLFAENWISFCVEGKWFLLIQLDAPHTRVAVKLQPDEAIMLRERYNGIRPAYHMNKTHWNDLYLNELDTDLVKRLIITSYTLVVKKLPKKLQCKYKQQIKELYETSENK